mmetsp:Transcript_39439/g.85814  ORF Transcript_39439/g.85814 Transcript_39439/m.85814 type:complete len:246 (-) Transcript_39439:6051-6788(-)
MRHLVVSRERVSHILLEGGKLRTILLIRGEVEGVKSVSVIIRRLVVEVQVARAPRPSENPVFQDHHIRTIADIGAVTLWGCAAARPLTGRRRLGMVATNGWRHRKIWLLKPGQLFARSVHHLLSVGNLHLHGLPPGGRIRCLLSVGDLRLHCPPPGGCIRLLSVGGLCLADPPAAVRHSHLGDQPGGKEGNLNLRIRGSRRQAHDVCAVGGLQAVQEQVLELLPEAASDKEQVALGDMAPHHRLC